MSTETIIPAIDARLLNARHSHAHHLIGAIYRDKKMRFADGEIVTTSPAKEIAPGIYETRSGTIYQVFFAKDNEQLLRDIASNAWIGLEGATPEDCPSGLSFVTWDDKEKAIRAEIGEGDAKRVFLLRAMEIGA